MGNLIEKILEKVGIFFSKGCTTIYLLAILVLAQTGILNLKELRENILLAYRSLLPSLEWLNETYWFNVMLFVSIGAFLPWFAWRRYCQNTKKEPDYVEVDVINKTDRMMFFIVNVWLLGIILGLKFNVVGTCILFLGECVLVAVVEAVLNRRS